MELIVNGLLYGLGIFASAVVFIVICGFIAVIFEVVCEFVQSIIDKINGE